MVTITYCPVCGVELQPRVRSFMSAPVVSINVEGLELQASAFVNYAQCPGCNLYVQSPRMSNEHITDYYKLGLYRKWLNQPQETLDNDERRRAQVDAKILREIVGDVSDHLDFGSSRGFFLEEMNTPMQAVS